VDNAEVSAALKMPHAAKMHLAGEGHIWPVEDWTFHLDEEEAPGKIFDALRAVASKLPAAERARVEAEVASLIAEHGPVREGLARGLVPDRAVAAAHGAREDMLVRRYKRQLLEYARRRIAQTGAGTSTDIALPYGAEVMFHIREPYTPDLVSMRPLRRSASVRTGAWFSSASYEEGSNFRVDPLSPDRAEYAIVPRDFAELEAVGGFPEVPSGEKFIDPWWRCIRAAETGGVEGPDWENGPAYLTALPRNSIDRVAAMREKIDSLASSPVGAGVKALDQQSRDSLENIATDLYTNYRTAEGRADLARRIGVPVDEINRKKDVVLEIMNRPEFSDFKSALVPLYAALLPFRDEIMKGISAAASSISGVGGGGLSGFSGAMPVIGAAVNFFVSTYQADQVKLDEDAARRCGLAALRLKDASEALAYKRYPFPWHTEMIASLADIRCQRVEARTHNNDAAIHLAMIAGLLEEWTYEFDRLPIPLKASIKQWWAITTTLMSSDKILPVFNALGSDPWGGRLATDEQVMLVAAPIAVVNGLDVDSFARRLWDRSRGYAAIMDSSPSFLRKAELSQWKMGVDEHRGICGPLIRNAFFANLAVLAYDALNLAEETKSEKVGLILKKENESFALSMKSEDDGTGFDYESEDDGTGFDYAPGSSVVPLAVGALATGGLYLAGASIGIMLAPLAAAVLYLALKD